MAILVLAAGAAVNDIAASVAGRTVLCSIAGGKGLKVLLGTGHDLARHIQLT